MKQLVGIAETTDIAKSPVMLALAVAGELPYAGDCRSVKVSCDLLGGDPRMASAIVVVDMCSDDSVKSRWYKVVLSMRDMASWEVDSVLSAWSCWEERGHVKYSAVPCK